jgi:hypothetical protein
MKHIEEPGDTALLLEELRRDVAADAGAVARVRERVAFSLSAAELGLSPERREWASQRRSGFGFARWGKAGRSGVLVALAVGTALGAGGHALVSAVVGHDTRTDTVELSPPRSTPPPAARAAPTAGLHASPSAVPLALPSASVTASEARPTPHAAPMTSPAPPLLVARAGMDAELRQLDQARAAVAAGNAGQALSALAAHAQRFPASMLRQERDALTVKALVAAGRYADARAAGERFAVNFPNSMLLDSVRNALATIP